MRHTRKERYRIEMVGETVEDWAVWDTVKAVHIGYFDTRKGAENWICKTSMRKSLLSLLFGR